jgi:hypothetical protein
VSSWEKSSGEDGKVEGQAFKTDKQKRKNNNNNKDLKKKL